MEFLWLRGDVGAIGWKVFFGGLSVVLLWSLASACGGKSGGATGDAAIQADASDAGFPGDGTLDVQFGTDGTLDGGMDTGGDGSAQDSGSSECPSLSLPSGLSKGMQWVRSEPMFISGLIPSMGAPSSSFASGYLDDFGANAVHLWQDGLPGEMDAWRDLRPAVRFVSWVLPDGTPAGPNDQVLGGYSGEPGRIGYQISDEPRDMADIHAIEAGVAAVRAADPGALVIINFGQVDDHSHPGDGGLIDDMISYVVDHHLADVLSYDNYSLQNSGYVWLEGFRAAGLAAGLPYWRYLNSYRSSPSDDMPSQADLRWHAMLGVVYGYQGHSWFVYQISAAHGSLTPVFFETAGDQNAQRTQQFGWAATINAELSYYGRVLTQLTSLGVRHLGTSGLLDIDAVQNYSPDEHIDPYLTTVDITAGYSFLGNLAQEILIGFFRDDADRRYLVVQNLNRDGRSTIGNHEDAMVRLTFDFANARSGLRTDRLERLDGASHSVVPMTLNPAGGSRATLELTIAAGDIAFLRYDDGCPWPGF